MYFMMYPQTGPSCSKNCYLSKLVNDKLVNSCSQGIFKYIDIFFCKNVSSFCNAKATHSFQQKIKMYLPYF